MRQIKFMKLKKIILDNYCGYRHLNLNLCEGFNDVKRWIIFCGPNGIGKSNFIRAAEMLTNYKHIEGRNNPRMLRKLKYHKNYISQISGMQSDISDLRMEAVFSYADDEERNIIIEDTYKGILGKIMEETLSSKEKELREWDSNNAVSGVTFNNIPKSINQISIYIDADHPNNMHKFQIYKELKEQFIDFAGAVYGFNCSLPEESLAVDNGIDFYTDFVLHKHWGTSVHYKSFSDGEKKIATLLSTLFKKCYKDSLGKSDARIILIDNIEMHIYWKRHMTLVEKMEEFFPDHQIICTTHSPIIVREMPEKYVYDIEKLIEKLIEKEN